MRIVVMGAGGVGGYMAARLAAAGEDVAVIARGRHLEAIRSEGLRIRSSVGDERVEVFATDDPAQAAPADIVLFTVKLYDMESAADAVAPLVGPETVVVPFLNGVDVIDVLHRRYGERTAGGVARIAAVIDPPGVIKHTGALANFRFGPLHPGQTQRLSAFHEACVRAGLDAHLSEDIRREVWVKMVFLSAFSGMTSVTRCTWGVVRETPATAELFRRAVAEAIDVARAQGVTMSDDAVEKTVEFGGSLPHEMKSSMQEDLERGRRLELPWLSGAIARLGRDAGVETPVHAFIEAVLTPHVNGRS